MRKDRTVIVRNSARANPTATQAQQAPIIERVEQILSAPDAPDVPQLEAEIDQLVYALYGLTDEEIALVERASVKGAKP